MSNSSSERHTACSLLYHCQASPTSSASSSHTVSSPEKLKILMLHGFGQTSSEFIHQTSRIAEFLEPDVEFIYAEAFHPVAGIASFFGGSSRGKQWYSMAPSSLGAGWMTSVEELRELCVTEKIDGVLGFSQGAAIASLIALESNLQFGCFLSGFLPNAPSMREQVVPRSATAPAASTKHRVTTWHCYAMDDEIVRCEKSKALAECFEQSSTAPTHVGGHSASSLPASVLKSLQQFVQQQQQCRIWKKK